MGYRLELSSPLFAYRAGMFALSSLCVHQNPVIT
jgi:hypothetical protein